MEQLLQRFWARVHHFTREGETYRIELMLREYGRMEFPRTASRNHHNRLCSKIRIAGCKCLLCSEDAVHRHHIIFLSRGGINHSLNYAPLCSAHHQTFHPDEESNDENHE